MDEKRKNMWVYEGCFAIISRNGIKVKFMDWHTKQGPFSNDINIFALFYLSSV